MLLNIKSDVCNDTHLQVTKPVCSVFICFALDAFLVSAVVQKTLGLAGCEDSPLGLCCGAVFNVFHSSFGRFFPHQLVMYPFALQPVSLQQLQRLWVV